jgi:hypothetical protein
MPGPKRVEDARERAYARASIPFAKVLLIDGLHRNSGLPELRIIYAPQVG